MSFKGKPGIWIVLIGLTGIAAQLAFTIALWDRLSFEEIAESIRNPYWVSNGEIYDGISSNVVYYKALDLYYRVSGFHLLAAKEFRLILSIFSICAIGLCLYRCTRFRFSSGMAFLAGVLSPTLLYFGTSQASFGIDLQIFPIIGAIWIFSLRSSGLISIGLLFIAAFMTVMLGAAFPPGLFYLPALIVVDILVRFKPGCRWRESLKVSIGRLSAIGAGILSGLIVPFLFIDNPLTLFYDPNTGSGLFRGGGRLSLNPFAVASAVWRSLLDLFSAGDSYQFYLPYPELGTVLALGVLVAMVSVLFCAISSQRPFHKDKLLQLAGQTNFQIALFASILFITFLVMSHISPNLPGLRRSAGMLVAFYLFYYLAIDACMSGTLYKNPKLQRVAFIALCLLPANRLIQLARNLNELPQHSLEAYPEWLKSHSTAQESLTVLYSEVKGGRPLTCSEAPAGCRYSVLFAALNLHHRSEDPDASALEVFAEDPNTGDIILVERSLWADHYWIH
jgi:hypothetical protein